MAKNNGPPIYLPEFPKNAFGLKRGSILRARRDTTVITAEGEKIYLPGGTDFAIGFNGEDVCSQGMLWDIRQLENEIRNGLWMVTTEYIVLSNRKILLSFIDLIERRPAILQ